MAFDISAAKSLLEKREKERSAGLALQLGSARRDFDAIVERLIKKYNPRRIYQWGSLLNEALYWEHSDIDIGVEGIINAAEHAAMQADAEELTRYPVDLVNLDRIDAWFAGSIRTNGRLVYERRS